VIGEAEGGRRKDHLSRQGLRLLGGLVWAAQRGGENAWSRSSYSSKSRNPALVSFLMHSTPRKSIMVGGLQWKGAQLASNSARKGRDSPPTSRFRKEVFSVNSMRKKHLGHPCYLWGVPEAPINTRKESREKREPASVLSRLKRGSRRRGSGKGDPRMSRHRLIRGRITYDSLLF